MSRLLRNIYKAIQYTFVLVSSRWSTFLFRTILRLNGVEVLGGVKSMKAIPSVVINRHSGMVHIGRNVTFNNYGDHSWYCKCKMMVRENAVLTIGDDTGMNGALIYASKEIRIGNNVKIGGGTRIYDTDFHSLNYQLRRNNETDCVNAKSAAVVIEDDVFVGAGCFIGKGVRIGARSIIAAGSVVVKSIPNDCVAGGNPCKVIKEMGGETDSD